MSSSSPCNAPERVRVRRRLCMAGLCATGLCAASAPLWVAAQGTRAGPPELLLEWPTARIQGQGQLRFLGLAVYEIALWTPLPALSAPDWWQAPLALEITYARALSGRRIAQRSLLEMQRAAAITADQGERWLDDMTQLFPDVQAGDRITGVQRPGQAARFYVNGNVRGELRDAEFTRLFFGIWLAPVTSQPALRSALLGLS